MSDDPNESRLGLLKKKVNLSNSDLYELAYNHCTWVLTQRSSWPPSASSITRPRTK